MNLENIKLEEFNDCIGKKEMIHYIETHHLGFITVEDDDQPFWKNDADTLVVSIRSEANPSAIAHLGKLAVDTHADEFDFMPAFGKIFFRFWWD